MGDISCIRTWAGYVYLATVLECATKKVVGYAMADRMRTCLVCEAIDMAVRNCPTVKGETIFHSDRGSQYTSQQFSAHLNRYGSRASVGALRGVLGQRLGRVLQRHAQERESAPDGLPHPQESHERYCLMDRADLQAHPAALSTGKPYTQRGRARAPGTPESSLTHTTTTVRRTPSTPLNLNRPGFCS